MILASAVLVVGGARFYDEIGIVIAVTTLIMESALELIKMGTVSEVLCAIFIPICLNADNFWSVLYSWELTLVWECTNVQMLQMLQILAPIQGPPIV